jgi:hypothetical protein
MSEIPDFIDRVLNEWETIACFAYDAFERQGRGVVFVETEDSGRARFLYGPADFFQQQKQTEMLRPLDLYDPATELLVQFQVGTEATRTLRIQTPKNGQSPKCIWFFRMLGLVVEDRPLPDYLPEWFLRALEDLKKAEEEQSRRSGAARSMDTGTGTHT